MRRERKQRIGTKVSNLVSTTLGETENIVHNGLYSIGAMFTGIANIAHETIIDGEEDLRDRKMDAALDNKDRITRLVEKGFTEEEALAILDTSRPRY